MERLNEGGRAVDLVECRAGYTLCFNSLKISILESPERRSPMAKARAKVFEYVEPIGARVLVRKDEPKRETKGGIALPDAAEIPTITGRIVTISAQVENDPDMPLRQYDRILFHPKGAIPVDFEPDNQLFVVPVEDVVAVFRREQREEDSSRKD